MKENNDSEYRVAAAETAGKGVKRNYKDGFFCVLFSEPKYALDLYRMFHPEDTDVGVEDITPITVDSIFAKGTVNDVAFRVRDQTFFLMEAQTNWTENIILRCLLYVMKFYTEYFEGRNKDLHRTKAIQVPLPEVYIYYAGDRDVPDCISFAETYGRGEPTYLDLKAHVIKTPPSGTYLGQYDDFCGRCKAAAEKGQLTREALRGIIDGCIAESILSDFLRGHRSEVMNMLEGYWDIEGIRQVEDEELREQVTKDVTAQVTKDVTAQVTKDVSEQKNSEFIHILDADGKTPDEIAAMLKLPIEKVKSILEAN